MSLTISNTDFESLDIDRVRYIVCDLDNFLFPYPEGYAESFSRHTARSAIEMANLRISSGSTCKLTHSLCQAEIDDVTERAKKSYFDHGFTTRHFADTYGFCESELYDAHHRLVLRDTVHPAFSQGQFINPRLRQGLLGLSDLMPTYLFTNGTEFYAREMTDKYLGLKDCFRMHVGIDSMRDKTLITKADRRAFNNFFALTRQVSATGHICAPEGCQGSPRGHEFYNGILCEDTPYNLHIAKNFFSLQTVLLKTDRVSLTKEMENYVDLVITDVGEFTNALASQVRACQRGRSGKVPAPRLSFVN